MSIYDETLQKLKDMCEHEEITIKEIKPWLDGYVVKFYGYDGDAACHMGTYGGPEGYWETYRMPWDKSEVTGWLRTEQLVYGLLMGELPDEKDE